MTLKGTVVDKKTGEPIIGANVIVQEQQAVHDTLLHGNGTKRQRP